MRLCFFTSIRKSTAGLQLVLGQPRRHLGVGDDLGGEQDVVEVVEHGDLAGIFGLQQILQDFGAVGMTAGSYIIGTPPQT